MGHADRAGREVGEANLGDQEEEGVKRSAREGIEKKQAENDRGGKEGNKGKRERTFSSN